MSFTSGSKIGPYSITGLLGKGGMGEVWKARDERLERDVAIKMIPEALAAEPELVARFEREARLLASLHHQNIAAVHGLEEHEGARYLVMEYVEGASLASRLANRKALDPHETLEICLQVAEGLEAAHAKGVIHRDVKPANIQISADGTAKVLDFGLARVVEGEGNGDGADWFTALEGSQTKARSEPGSDPVQTTPGTLLGTVPYMSPEQARGLPLDKRTDIWSFGCVLYECLTGQRTYSNESQADTLGAILHTDPDWTKLPQATPPTIALLLRRCLAKDRRRR